MFEIELPHSGCNVYYGTYIDNYHNNTRTRYYLNETKLIKSTTSTYSHMPDGYTCISQGDLVYKPETEIYFYVISIIFAIAIFLLAVRLFFFPFWRRVR